MANILGKTTFNKFVILGYQFDSSVLGDFAKLHILLKLNQNGVQIELSGLVVGFRNHTRTLQICLDFREKGERCYER